MSKKYRRTRVENIEMFRQIVHHITNSDEFHCGGITSAEKVFTGYLGITKAEVADIEVKLYKAFKQFIKKEK